jgi:hypothetical protein
MSGSAPTLAGSDERKESRVEPTTAIPVLFHRAEARVGELDRGDMDLGHDLALWVNGANDV